MTQPNGHSAEALSSLQLAYERLQAQAAFQAAFLGTASHELRAPINQIISLHQLILEGLCESPEEEQEFLTQANEAIYKVLHNLDLLINLSKLDIGAQSPKLQPVEIDALLSEAKQLTEMQCINRHCRLNVQGLVSDAVAIADPQWLRQTLLLLIEGALVADSTQITLITQLENATTLAILIHCNSPIAKWQEKYPPIPPTQSKTTQLPKPIEISSLSPHFRCQLAQRLVNHLRSEFHLGPATDSTSTQFRITLPLALEN